MEELHDYVTNYLIVVSCYNSSLIIFTKNID